MRLKYTRVGWLNRRLIVDGKTLNKTGDTVEVDDDRAKQLLADYPDELAPVKPVKTEDADEKAAPSNAAQSPTGQSATTTRSTTRKGD